MSIESTKSSLKNNKTKKLSIVGQTRKNNVFVLMNKHGLSRKQFAEFVGVSYDTLMIYIAPSQNKRQIGTEICSRIENAFNLPESSMDTDLSDKDDINNKNNLLMSECSDERIGEKILRVPLFLSQVGTYLDAKTELYIEETFISLTDVFGNKVQPENVVAFRIFETYGFLPALATVFIDQSNKTPGPKEQMYLVSSDNHRKLVLLNSTTEMNAIILGRVFFLKMAI